MTSKLLPGDLIEAVGDRGYGSKDFYIVLNVNRHYYPDTELAFHSYDLFNLRVMKLLPELHGNTIDDNCKLISRPGSI